MDNNNQDVEQQNQNNEAVNIESQVQNTETVNVEPQVQNTETVNVEPQVQNNETVNIEPQVQNNQATNIVNSQPQQKKSPIVKILAIIGGIVVGMIILVVVIFSVFSANSKKLVCKSSEGNITLMYNNSGITGYTASKISYDLDQQKLIANQIGVDAYLEEFTTWFETNTTGTCAKK